MQDLTGKRFGKLTVLKLHHTEQAYLKNGQKNGFRAYYLCQCDCGKFTVVQNCSLIGGKTKSCGCLHNANSKIGELNKTHGKTKTRIYKIWQKMKERCHNSNANRYFLYGARGIIVCKEWKDNFIAFYDWAMANGYTDDLSIDRINVNGNYEPSNCRWASVKEQANNKNDNFKVVFRGKEKTLAEWAEVLNIKYSKLHQRLKKLKWSVERALSTP